MASYTEICNSLKKSLGDVSIGMFKVYFVGALIDASYYDGFTLPTSNGRYSASTDSRDSDFAEKIKSIIKNAKTPDECVILLQAEKINCVD